MKKFISIFVFFVIVISLVISGCNNRKKNDESIKIGSILPLTGPAAVYGEYSKKGQLKALEIVNNEILKNSKIEIIFQDGQGRPKESINAYHKLRRDNINIFTTTVSSVCLSILPQAEADNVLLFANAAHPQITNSSSDLVFRHSNTSIQEADLILDHLQAMGNISLGVIYLNDDYGLSEVEYIKNEISKYPNLNLVFTEEYQQDVKDFNTLAKKLSIVNPDVTLIISFGPSMGLLIKKIKEMQIDTHIIASIGLIITGAKTTAGEAAKGIEYVNFNFTDDMEDKINVNPFESLEFGTILLIGEAVSKVGGDPNQIARYIKEMGSFNSGLEQMKILNNNDILPDLKIDKFE